ncbi:MAG: hypothetical protein OEZ34_16525 [Spirochaetia bacterium]|nr:hypothetical protein [Spirochaetia bacterium]
MRKRTKDSIDRRLFDIYNQIMKRIVLKLTSVLLLAFFLIFCGNSEEKDLTFEELLIRYTLFCPTGKSACLSSCDVSCSGKPSLTERNVCMTACSDTCALNCDAVILFIIAQQK